ncbi:MAG: TusE/DsrC/DsvC family sulfur relay protein [Candidatus Sumerlaeota bacterium]|nr:TusE/DsrC/DsvC family sulfur relay protein [Candidatus Sumerlaeota bacterium]
MPIQELGGQPLEVDDDGFLVDSGQWTESAARDIASLQGIEPLTPDHWKVIRYLRSYYLEHEVTPRLRAVCDATGLKLKNIYELFPMGPTRGACKIAGVPKPPGCI